MTDRHGAIGLAKLMVIVASWRDALSPYLCNRPREVVLGCGGARLLGRRWLWRRASLRHGEIDDGEVCDDGRNDGSYDSCAADCSARAAHCGDAVVDVEDGEICDDGVNDALDGGCLLGCRREDRTAEIFARPCWKSPLPWSLPIGPLCGTSARLAIAYLARPIVA